MKLPAGILIIAGVVILVMVLITPEVQIVPSLLGGFITGFGLSLLIISRRIRMMHTVGYRARCGCGWSESDKDLAYAQREREAHEDFCPFGTQIETLYE